MPKSSGFGTPPDQSRFWSFPPTFTAAASGSPAPTVQWQVSINNGPFANIALANQTTLSFTANSVQNGNRYRAVFTNVAGNATTNPATLTINTPPLVTLNPASQAMNSGQSVTFTAAASGAPTVQWQVSVNNGPFTNILLANSTMLTFTADVTQNGNRYQAVFTNPCGMTTTTPASLTVNVVILVNESIKVTDSPAVNNTSSGNNVAIKPVDTTSGSSPVTLTFSTVTQPGLTSLTTSSNGPPPPSGFQLGNPAEYYNLTTTATFTGTILVVILRFCTNDWIKFPPASDQNSTRVTCQAIVRDSWCSDTAIPSMQPAVPVNYRVGAFVRVPERFGIRPDS